MFDACALRTSDVDAARRFYDDALGLELPDRTSDELAFEAWPLHERALALGVPPHWLVFADVDDVHGTVAAMTSDGATLLSPPVTRVDGVVFAVLRDPRGAVFAVRDRQPARRTPFVWHHLHTVDADGATVWYARHLRWQTDDVIEDPTIDGGLRPVRRAWGGPVGGMIANTGRWPGVHVHWLPHMLVEDVDGAILRVRLYDGVAMHPRTLPDGSWVAACEDPQGAAFAVIQRRAVPPLT